MELYCGRREVEKVSNRSPGKRTPETSVWWPGRRKVPLIIRNLRLIYEDILERKHGVSNQGADQRRAKRIAGVARQCAAAANGFRPWFYAPGGPTSAASSLFSVCASPSATELRTPPLCSVSRRSMPI